MARAWVLALAALAVLVGPGMAAGPTDPDTSCQPDKLTVYKMVMHTFWSRDRFPKHYPDWRPPAQWSKVIGKSHTGIGSASRRQGTSWKTAFCLQHPYTTTRTANVAGLAEGISGPALPPVAAGGRRCAVQPAGRLRHGSARERIPREARQCPSALAPLPFDVSQAPRLHLSIHPAPGRSDRARSCFAPPTNDRCVGPRSGGERPTLDPGLASAAARALTVKCEEQKAKGPGHRQPRAGWAL